jgi:hypothetical protein
MRRTAVAAAFLFVMAAAAAAYFVVRAPGRRAPVAAASAASRHTPSVRQFRATRAAGRRAAGRRAAGRRPRRQPRDSVNPEPASASIALDDNSGAVGISGIRSSSRAGG